MSTDIAWVEGFFNRLNPREGELLFRDELQEDECRWFRKAVDSGVIEIRPCAAGCRLDWDAEHPRRDEFVIPHQRGEVRHLLTVERSGRVYVSREYIPHVAAYARAILQLGYLRERSSFSLYRRFGEATVERTGKTGCETDAEFYETDGDRVYLHIEVKKDAMQVEKIAEDIRRLGALGALPDKAAKELDYVLDIKPRYLWLVGPGSVDPEKHVYTVSVKGHDAHFRQVDSLPSPP